MDLGSPTITNSSLSSSRRRKVDWGEDLNPATKYQKIQKTTFSPWKENNDTAFSLSEYLNMSPMQ
nr:14153_t:CDS:2 [Entrophospora candida]